MGPRPCSRPPSAACATHDPRLRVRRLLVHAECRCTSAHRPFGEPSTRRRRPIWCSCTSRSASSLGSCGLLRVDVSGLLPASVRDLSRSDALVDLAGVSFIDGREKFLPFNILTIWPAMLMGVPVFKLSQAVGPFRQTLNRRAAGRCSSAAACSCHAGRTTLEHVSELGIPADRRLPGTGHRVLLPRAGLAVGRGCRGGHAAARPRRGATAAGASSGICPSSVIASKAAKEGWDYVGFLAEVVRTLVADGRLVVLFPNATRADAGRRPAEQRPAGDPRRRRGHRPRGI